MVASDWTMTQFRSLLLAGRTWRAFFRLDHDTKWRLPISWTYLHGELSSHSDWTLTITGGLLLVGHT